MYCLDRVSSVTIPEIKMGKTSRTAKFLIAEGNEGEVRHFQLGGIAQEFAKLKTDKNILDFANRYGFLGVELRDVTTDLKYAEILDFEYVDPKYTMETLEIWRWHIDHINNLFRLHNVLKNKDGDIEDIIWIEEVINTSDRENPTYKVTWKHNGRAVFPKPIPHLDINKIIDTAPSSEELGRVLAMYLLFLNTRAMLNNAVTVEFSAENDLSAPMKFRLIERKVTKHLLAAIHYDLWKTINDPKYTIKNCEICGSPFTAKHKDTRFCGKACQKKNQRLTK